MREGWAYKQIDEICSIDYGTRVVQKNEVGGSKYYVYGGGGATFKIDRFNRENCFIVSRFAMSPKCTRYVSGKFFLNDSGLSVSTKDNKSLRQSFVDKALWANNDVIYAMGKGVAQKNLDMPSFRRLQIPVPPVQEQEKIVAELDCLSGIIEKKKQQLKELDNLAQSIFYDMFGDPYEQSLYDVKPLDAYCKIFGRIGFRGYTRNDFVETAQEGAISLSPSNIINGEMDYSKCSYITWFKYEESPEIKIYNGDILVVKTGSSYGKVALVKDLPHKASINPQFVVLKEIQCNRYFLEYYLKTSFARDKYEEFVIGTAIPTFSQKKLGTLPIVDVPIDLQNAFAHKIGAIEKQKELIKKSIQETETLFNSRMDYWFN